MRAFRGWYFHPIVNFCSDAGRAGGEDEDEEESVMDFCSEGGRRSRDFVSWLKNQ
jgi:hypothetical protein